MSGEKINNRDIEAQTETWGARNSSGKCRFAQRRKGREGRDPFAGLRSDPSSTSNLGHLLPSEKEKHFLPPSSDPSVARPVPRWADGPPSIAAANLRPLGEGKTFFAPLTDPSVARPVHRRADGPPSPHGRGTRSSHSRCPLPPWRIFHPLARKRLFAKANFLSCPPRRGCWIGTAAGPESGSCATVGERLAFYAWKATTQSPLSPRAPVSRLPSPVFCSSPLAGPPTLPRIIYRWILMRA